MVIYIDVLVLLNFIIDYLIIRLTSKITTTRIKNLRLIISSFIASLFSLIILLPDLGIFFQHLVIIISSLIITLLSFGRKKFFKNLMAFISINVIYNGLITTVWMLFKPRGIIINNSVTYFNISPLIFIVSTIAFYFLIILVQLILKKKSPYAKRCVLKLKNDNNEVEISAIVDTGNTICDPYSNRQVIITDNDTAQLIFDNLRDLPQLLLPVNSVGGSSLMPAYVCNNVRINNKNISALIAITEHKFSGDYKAIVNPQILEEV